MSSLTSTNLTGLSNDLYWQEETVKIADGSEQRLTQEDFFAMLTEQLSNQDPTKPVENDQMVAQMTAFSTAEGITQLNESFNSFASSMTSNQALQASSLIGQSVLVKGDVAYMSAGVNSEGETQVSGVSGVIVNDATVQDMTITIQNGLGEVVKTIDAGTRSAGNIQFEWDGLDKNGNPQAPGQYYISANGSVDGEGTSLPIAVNRTVGSVSMASGNGIILNLDGDVSINLDDVIQLGG